MAPHQQRSPQARLELIIDVPLYDFKADAFLQQHGLASLSTVSSSASGRVASIERLSAVGPGKTSVLLHCHLPEASRLQRAYAGEKPYTHHGIPTKVQVLRCSILTAGQQGHLRLPSVADCKAKTHVSLPSSSGVAAAGKLTQQLLSTLPADRGSSAMHRPPQGFSSSCHYPSADHEDMKVQIRLSGRRGIGAVLDVLGDSILDVFEAFTALRHRCSDEGEDDGSSSEDEEHEFMSSSEEEGEKKTSERPGQRARRRAATKARGAEGSGYTDSKAEAWERKSPRSPAAGRRRPSTSRSRHQQASRRLLKRHRRKTTLGEYLRPDTTPLSSFNDLLSLRDAASILSRLHQRQLVFNIRPSMHAVALALVHLSRHGQQQVCLTPRALRNVRQVAGTSLGRHRSHGTGKKAAWALRMWASLTARALVALERSTLLFPHLCFVSVVLLQDFMLRGPNPISFTPDGPPDETIQHVVGGDDEDEQAGSMGRGARLGSPPPPAGSMEVQGDEEEADVKSLLLQAFDRHHVFGDGDHAKVQLRFLRDIFGEAGCVSPASSDLWRWAMARQGTHESCWYISRSDLQSFLDAHPVVRLPIPPPPATPTDPEAADQHCHDETEACPSPPLPSFSVEAATSPRAKAPAMHPPKEAEEGVEEDWYSPSQNSPPRAAPATQWKEPARPQAPPPPLSSSITAGRVGAPRGGRTLQEGSTSAPVTITSPPPSGAGTASLASPSCSPPRRVPERKGIPCMMTRPGEAMEEGRPQQQPRPPPPSSPAPPSDKKKTASGSQQPQRLVARPAAGGAVDTATAEDGRKAPIEGQAPSPSLATASPEPPTMPATVKEEPPSSLNEPLGSSCATSAMEVPVTKAAADQDSVSPEAPALVMAALSAPSRRAGEVATPPPVHITAVATHHDSSSGHEAAGHGDEGMPALPSPRGATTSHPSSPGHDGATKPRLVPVIGASEALSSSPGKMPTVGALMSESPRGTAASSASPRVSMSPRGSPSHHHALQVLVPPLVGVGSDPHPSQSPPAAEPLSATTPHAEASAGLLQPLVSGTHGANELPPSSSSSPRVASLGRSPRHSLQAPMTAKLTVTSHTSPPPQDATPLITTPVIPSSLPSSPSRAPATLVSLPSPSHHPQHPPHHSPGAPPPPRIDEDAGEVTSHDGPPPQPRPALHLATLAGPPSSPSSTTRSLTAAGHSEQMPGLKPSSPKAALRTGLDKLPPSPHTVARQEQQPLASSNPAVQSDKPVAPADVMGGLKGGTRKEIGLDGQEEEEEEQHTTGPKRPLSSSPAHQQQQAMPLVVTVPAASPTKASEGAQEEEASEAGVVLGGLKQDQLLAPGSASSEGARVGTEGQGLEDKKEKAEATKASTAAAQEVEKTTPSAKIPLKAAAESLGQQQETKARTEPEQYKPEQHHHQAQAAGRGQKEEEPQQASSALSPSTSAGTSTAPDNGRQATRPSPDAKVTSAGHGRPRPKDDKSGTHSPPHDNGSGARTSTETLATAPRDDGPSPHLKEGTGGLDAKPTTMVAEAKERVSMGGQSSKARAADDERDGSRLVAKAAPGSARAGSDANDDDRARVRSTSSSSKEEGGRRQEQQQQRSISDEDEEVSGRKADSKSAEAKQAGLLSPSAAATAAAGKGPPDHKLVTGAGREHSFPSSKATSSPPPSRPPMTTQQPTRPGGAAGSGGVSRGGRLSG